MATNRSWGSRAGARFEARCAWCGPVTLSASDLVVHVSVRTERADALFEFDCPRCLRTNLRGVDGPDVLTLNSAGVAVRRDAAPFELLEERSGPPIGWDDLLDFHQALDERDAA
jgi:hypothetical protein